jgi:hypothetical protein
MDAAKDLEGRGLDPEEIVPILNTSLASYLWSSLVVTHAL